METTSLGSVLPRPRSLENIAEISGKSLFVAMFLGCTSTGRVGLCFLWFFVQELLKAQPAVVLVLKRLRRRGNGLKSHPTDWEKPGIEPATPGLQDIGLSPTPRRLFGGKSRPKHPSCESCRGRILINSQSKLSVLLF